ncbi:MAG: S41 family peptidase, partial [Acidobacteriota bacterium]
MLRRALCGGPGIGVALLVFAPPAIAAQAPAPSSVESLLEAAAAARGRQEMVRAAALYGRVLEQDPGHRVALYNLGVILENAGEARLARAVWREALDSDPGDLFVYEHLLRNLSRPEGLQAELRRQRALVQAAPGAKVPRLFLALALEAAGQRDEAVARFESYLLDEPGSNIAYLFLKDAFESRAAYLAYLDDVARRSQADGAPEPLRLLQIRLLLERGRVGEAHADAASWAWQSETSRRLLDRAGLLPVERENRPPRRPTGQGAHGSRTAGDAPPAAPGSRPSLPAPVRSDPSGPQDFSSEKQPDSGPDDPQSAARPLDLGRAAVEAGDDSRAVAELRRALTAAPLRLQPRVLLALALKREGREEEAREALKGPVEVSPWDLYMQAWRSVRDDSVDADYGGVDIFRRRAQARRRVRTVADAKREMAALLADIGDRYARLFEPDAFAGYLLAPNAHRRPLPGPAGGPGMMSPSVTVPADSDPKAARKLRAAPPVPDLPRSAGGDRGLGPEREPPAGAGAPPPAPAPGREPSTLPEKRPATETSRRAGTDIPRGLWQDPRVQVARLDGSIGYLLIPSLGGLDPPDQVETALATVPDARGWIIDLRGNGGGDGNVAVEVAARFLPRGSLVCTYLARRGPVPRVTTRESPHRPRGPLALLVDARTASAAELLAAALHDRAGAILVGETTAGKGVGQKALLLPDGSGLSVTQFRLLAPRGTGWDDTGLHPDLEIAAAHQEAALEAARGWILARLADEEGTGARGDKERIPRWDPRSWRDGGRDRRNP